MSASEVTKIFNDSCRLTFYIFDYIYSVCVSVDGGRPDVVWEWTVNTKNWGRLNIFETLEKKVQSAILTVHHRDVEVRRRVEGLTLTRTNFRAMIVSTTIVFWSLISQDFSFYVRKIR